MPAFADAPTGWTEVTSLSDLSSYYFVIADNTSGKMLRLGAKNATIAKDTKLYYDDAVADPFTDTYLVWYIEPCDAANGLYYIRNMAFPYVQIQTESSGAAVLDVNDVPTGNTWSNMKLEYASDAWTIENYHFTANTEKYWGADATDATLVVGNKTSETAGKFKIYAYQRSVRGSSLGSGATSSSPANMSSMILNSDFMYDRSNLGYGGWTPTKNDGSQAFNNHVGEFFNNTSFDFYQTVSGLPNGCYTAAVQAFYRDAETTDNTTNDKVYFYAGNSRSVAIKGIGNRDSGTTKPTDTGTANTAFNEKNDYQNTLTAIYVTDGTLILGLKKEDRNNEKDWCCFDNFGLQYLGVPSSTNLVDFTAYINNPSFSSQYSTGWTSTGTAPNAYDSTYGAHEAYHRVGGLSQDLTGLPAGVYEVSMQVTYRDDAGQTSPSFYLFGRSDVHETRAVPTQAPDGDFANNAKRMSEDENFGKITTHVLVGSGGTLTIGYYESCDATWPVFDNFTLKYLGNETDALGVLLNQVAADFKTTIDRMPTSAVKTSLTALYDSKKTASDAATYQANINFLSTWNITIGETVMGFSADLSAAAQVTADASHTETTSGAHDTYTAAIAAHASAVAAATTAAAVKTADATLRTAIKTYLSGVTPATEGGCIEITSLVKNPAFNYNDKEGWTETNSGGHANTYYSCNEFWNNTFDFYQELSGLPEGSYSLSVQAFSRPGTNTTAYTEYKAGTNNVTAELYVNSDASRVSNVFSYTGNTTGAKVGTGTESDFHCDSDGDNYWVPNSMKGASLYFADENVYKTSVAALVENGNLKIGFRDAELTGDQWTIFDNFKLYYYGSSKLIYYKQYLPQLRIEAQADLDNAAYNIVTGKERSDLTAAIAANPASETEAAYKTVIDAIKDAQAALTAASAVTAYTRLAAANAEATSTTLATAYTVTSETTAATALTQANSIYSTMLAAVSVDKTQGFEAGEYAPYNNIAAFTALAAAQAITDVPNTETSTLDAVITAANSATWEANTAEVNGFYRGSFSEYTTSDITGDNRVAPTGWSNTNTTNTGVLGLMATEPANAGSSATANKGLAGLTSQKALYLRKDASNTYGTTSGYELPLKAETVYALTMKWGGWGYTDSKVTVTVKKGDTTIESKELTLPSGAKKANEDAAGWQDATVRFLTTDAGNYSITFAASTNQAAIADLSLLKATAENITLSEEATEAPVTPNYANVTLTRTLSSEHWNTFCLPFDMTAEQISTTFGEGTKITEYDSEDNTNRTVTMKEATEIEAGVPYLIKPATTTTNPTISSVIVKEAAGKTVGTSYKFIGVIQQTEIAAAPTDGTLNYFLNTDNQMVKPSATGDLKGMRAYFNIPAAASGETNDVRVLISGFDDESTGISTVQSDASPRTGTVYDLSGRRVQNPQHGIYVKNGKKVVIK